MSRIIFNEYERPGVMASLSAAELVGTCGGGACRVSGAAWRRRNAAPLPIMVNDGDAILAVAALAALGGPTPFELASTIERLRAELRIDALRRRGDLRCENHVACYHFVVSKPAETGIRG